MRLTLDLSPYWFAGIFSRGHKAQSDFLARASLHWHVQGHEAEEIVSSTCCPPSFVGCRRGEYVPEKAEKVFTLVLGFSLDMSPKK